MNRKKLKIAVAEAKRFIKRAEALPAPVTRKFYDGSTYLDCKFPVEQGAIRRASMDLTRSLANLRRPS